MSTSERMMGGLMVALSLGACSTLNVGKPAAPTGPGLGQPASAAQVAAWDLSIGPDGAGLPAGSGNAEQGALVYQAKCQSCHGEKGMGQPADALVGGIGSLASGKPVRTVGSYWPYATTLFDYVRRAMPINNPLSLTNDEVYAVSAYVLFQNGIVAQTAPMTALTLPAVRMPNRDGFISDWPVRAPR